MSRIEYSDDEEYPGQFELWRANVERSLAGRRGQAALRDLEAALLALPERRLIENRLVKGDDVCANGALVALRRQAKTRLSRAEILAQMAEETAPTCATCWCQKVAHGPLGCSTCPARIEKLVKLDAEWAADREAQGLPPIAPGPTQRHLICTEYVASDWDELDDYGGDGKTERVAESEGVPRLVAWAIMESNDDPGEWHRDVTDEQRYERVLAWTRSKLRPHGSA